MRRPVFQRADMPTQRWLADPRRTDGASWDGTMGDCFRTAFAGALGLPRDDVPHFVGMAEGYAAWWRELNDWSGRNYGSVVAYWDTDRWQATRAEHPDRLPVYPGRRGYVVVSGPSPRGPFHHACVADLDLNVVHDPHPLGMGLESVSHVYVMAPGVWLRENRRALTARAA